MACRKAGASRRRAETFGPSRAPRNSLGRMEIPTLARRLHVAGLRFSEPSKMDTNTQAQGFLVGIRQILIHGAITLLAIVIAFSLPPAARYILYVWWPRVEPHTTLLLLPKIPLPSAL